MAKSIPDDIKTKVLIDCRGYDKFKNNYIKIMISMNCYF